MNPRHRVILFGLLVTLTVFAVHRAGVADDAAPEGEGAAFAAVQVHVDSGAEALAAWQIDLRAGDPDVQIIGIEGGEHPAFADPPAYDPDAMQTERVIVADFDTRPAAQLPTGRTRLLTVHVLHAAGRPPRFEATLVAAANADGRRIVPTVDLVVTGAPR